GDLLVAEHSQPQSSKLVTAKLVWLHADPCEHGKSYLLKHGTRTVRARVGRIMHRVDVNTLNRLSTSVSQIVLQLNDIATVQIESSLPLFFDPYALDRIMGSFILIDPMTNATVAAGMIEGASEPWDNAKRDGNLPRGISLEERTRRNGHPPAALWIVDR